MEHTDLHKIIQTLLPIAIFVLWAILSRPALKRKKQQEALGRNRRLEHAEEQRNQGASPSEQPAPQQRHESGREIMKRTLDEILGEMGVPVEHEETAPRPVEPPHHEKEEIPPERESLKDLKPETESVQEPEHIVTTTVAAPVSAYTQHDSPITSKTAYSVEPSLAAQSTLEHQRLQNLSDYSPRELQRLIVWSEVLGKPLALRDEQ